MITKEQLVSITNKPKIIDRLYNSIVECLNKYNINTNLRISHFLAQVLHESGCFVYFEEIASGAAYEGRKDLGNVNKGDGILFKGRGLIQITGRANYTQLSKDLGTDFVKVPNLLASDKWAVISAGWFWNSRNLNNFADKDDFLSITKKVNGGTTGLEDRKKWLDKCKSIIK